MKRWNRKRRDEEGGGRRRDDRGRGADDSRLSFGRRTILGMNWKPVCLLLAWLPGAAQTYSGPKPPKRDVPYLVQAGKLIPVETTQVKEEDRKEGPVFAIDGAASPVKTPMAEPIFLFDSGSTAPQSLELYKLEVNGGHREVSTGGTKSARALRGRSGFR